MDKNTSDSLYLSDISVTDVMDIELLQSFLDNFAVGMNIASVAVDINGKPITQPSSYTNICLNYTHSTKVGDDRCAASHKNGGEIAARTKRPYIFKCHAGLIDFAAPIMIDGVQIGTILGGQILTEKPNEIEFRKTAREIGVNEEEYVAASNEVNITAENNIKAAAEVLFIVANALSQIGYQELKIKKTSNVLLESFSQIAATMEELAAASGSVSENQEMLNNEITNISNISEHIIEVLSSIKSIADQTKLVGLNASIEAARAGEAGRVFSVVATEIRNMSQSSKETAINIEKLANEIQTSLSKTISISQATLLNVEQQAAGIQETTASTQELLSITNELYQMANKE